MDTTALAKEPKPAEGGGNDRLHGVSYWLAILFGGAGILLTINQTFNLHLTGQPILDTSFYYLMLGLFLSLAFLAYPAHRGARRRIPWYDWALFATCAAAAGFLAWNGARIVAEGWDIVAPQEAVVIAGIVCLLALEAVRRAGGIVLFAICAIFAVYPMFAEGMPGVLWGPSSTLPETLTAHALGVESIIGVPLRTVASLLVGFLIFGSALVVTGGGEFFMALAVSLLGSTRGGPAKVSVIASGFFGSLSGSVISNVVTTGQLTIPTMKRVGYPPHYAGAVEACASTGGALMPPVMGAVAFIMAEFLNVPYSTVIIAAVVPALLYYGSLVLQADFYAARNGLKGQPREEIPPLLPVIRKGWHFLFSLALLTYLLLVMKREALAPYIATCVLLATTLVFGSKRFGLAGLRDLAIDTTRNIVGIVAVLAGVGFIVGSLSYTGVGGAFSRELLQFAGGNIYLLLVLGALTSFVLGMGMTATACYIFLAVTLAPALVEGGLHPTASHLFILYWGLISFITPPVALAAIAAASIAKADSWRTGVWAMRLGLVNLVVPFLFVLNPTLILVGEPLHILHDVATACFAVWMLAAALEGWLVGIGRIGWASRAILGVAALGMLAPGLASDLVGGGLLLVVYAGNLALRRRAGRAARVATLAVLAALAATPAAAVPPADPPGDPALREAIRLTEAGRHDLSVPMLEEVLARLPGDPDILTYLALALRRTGRFAEAEARYEQALARDAAHLPALAYQGVLFLETGRRAAAEANLRRLSALCPAGCAEQADLAREIAARR